MAILVAQFRMLSAVPDTGNTLPSTPAMMMPRMNPSM
ncbi:Uncharacterised protein [Mycobacteroides abscessus subsp. abscessus]|nr:Uncharacterised protein [Mycobacteroides abscessus subsp. abscessus]